MAVPCSLSCAVLSLSLVLACFFFGHTGTVMHCMAYLFAPFACVPAYPVWFVVDVIFSLLPSPLDGVPCSGGVVRGGVEGTHVFVRAGTLSCTLVLVRGFPLPSYHVAVMPRVCGAYLLSSLVGRCVSHVFPLCSCVGWSSP